ncbi:oligosaccharide flippase family protein [Roseovarius sp. D22-M7]|uniref:oligosaccharide flippase family protein n=1 Tax=Roseovarius sp. D22-M7 TaxID=3127116 RepID=UPI00300F92F0
MAKTFLVNAGSLSASRIFLSLSQVLVLPLVARFLDPVDFGDMALAMSVVVFAQILSDAGMGRSLIRQPQYDPAEWNSVFWLLTCVGLILTLAILALAPVWANLFDRPQLLWLLLALAVLPFLNSLSAVSVARMEKDGQFPKLAVIRTAAGLVGLIALLVLTVAGAGVWALVAQQIGITATRAVWAIFQSPFRPGPPRNFVPLGGHARFATDNVGVSLIFTAQRQAPILLIGAFIGAGPLGLFSMAQRFLNLPRPAVAGPVAQVVYVRMTNVQDDGRKLAEIYVASCLMLSVAVFPPMAVLAGSASSLFPLLLSETWAPAAMIFVLAAPGIMMEIAPSNVGVLLQALDRTRLRLWMNLERTILRTLAIALAVPFGLEAVALVISVFSLFYLPRYISFAQRVAPVSQRAVLRAMAIPAATSAGAWMALDYCGRVFGNWEMLGLACVVLPLTWAVTILLQRTRMRRAISLLNS